jgi:hypothetical protein
MKVEDRELTKIACSRILNELHRANKTMEVKSIVDKKIDLQEMIQKQAEIRKNM